MQPTIHQNLATTCRNKKASLGVSKFCDLGVSNFKPYLLDLSSHADLEPFRFLNSSKLHCLYIFPARLLLTRFLICESRSTCVSPSNQFVGKDEAIRCFHRFRCHKGSLCGQEVLSGKKFWLQGELCAGSQHIKLQLCQSCVYRMKER